MIGIPRLRDIVYSRLEHAERSVPLYYFDIHDGESHTDNVGTECADIGEVCTEARRVMPEIAREIFPMNGDHHTMRVAVRDEDQDMVYTATLVFSGQIIAKPTIM